MKQWIPGWIRINENQFKAAIASAMQSEPDLCSRLRRAIRATAAGRVEAQTINQYLGWINEVEDAVSAMAEAEQTNPTPDIAPTKPQVPTQGGA
jgi:hypothetical protein